MFASTIALILLVTTMSFHKTSIGNIVDLKCKILLATSFT